MSTLDGEKIEQVLFDEGLDCSQVTRGDFTYLSVCYAGRIVEVGPIWNTDGESYWFMDDDDVAASLYEYHAVIDTDTFYPESEEDLIDYIIGFASGNL